MGGWLLETLVAVKNLSDSICTQDWYCYLSNILSMYIDVI